ncbi:uncharacterized protein LOC132706194 [Cylas formicarius]|uniref:uncharacterized protein LOC132706194 n=1 Tax=Cylas formicarius TaxID=197179 RepID=UPI002958AC03|nr:uncharacterized protein LOC132706194 [Cylas formicarius]
MICFGLCFVCFIQICLTAYTGRGPPKVEKIQNFSDSYIPASMQVIAHLSELMKYELNPQPSTTTTSTTTMRPTPSHKPGVYAPENPQAYYANRKTYQEFVKELQEPSGPNYFDRYYFLEPPNDHLAARSLSDQEEDDFAKEIDSYFGKGFAHLFKLANKVDDDCGEEGKFLQFSKNFDDVDFGLELLRQLRQKRIPPTRAYVTLLNLYDTLNKEAKRLGLSKFNGYNNAVLKTLVDSSSGTSSDQLKIVLRKLLDNQDSKKPDVVARVREVLQDLEQPSSYINAALKGIPPLKFAWQFAASSWHCWLLYQLCLSTMTKHKPKSNKLTRRSPNF